MGSGTSIHRRSNARFDAVAWTPSVGFPAVPWKHNKAKIFTHSKGKKEQSRIRSWDAFRRGRNGNGCRGVNGLWVCEAACERWRFRCFPLFGGGAWLCAWLFPRFVVCQAKKRERDVVHLCPARPHHRTAAWTGGQSSQLRVAVRACMSTAASLLGTRGLLHPWPSCELWTVF